MLLAAGWDATQFGNLDEEFPQMRVEENALRVELASDLLEGIVFRVELFDAVTGQVVDFPQCGRASYCCSSRSSSRRNGSYVVPGLPDTDTETVSRWY